ncbi:hypothetical protein D3C86_2250410 [compost metagenome]
MQRRLLGLEGLGMVTRRLGRLAGPHPLELESFSLSLGLRESNSHGLPEGLIDPADFLGLRG